MTKWFSSWELPSLQRLVTKCSPFEIKKKNFSSLAYWSFSNTNIFREILTSHHSFAQCKKINIELSGKLSYFSNIINSLFSVILLLSVNSEVLSAFTAWFSFMLWHLMCFIEGVRMENKKKYIFSLLPLFNGRKVFQIAFKTFALYGFTV